MVGDVMKRSINISNHSTSIFIEEEFWQGLKEIAFEKKISVPALISEIDRESLSAENSNLSSRVKVYVLQYYRGKCGG